MLLLVLLNDCVIFLCYRSMLDQNGLIFIFVVLVVVVVYFNRVRVILTMMPILLNLSSCIETFMTMVLFIGMDFWFSGGIVKWNRSFNCIFSRCCCCRLWFIVVTSFMHRFFYCIQPWDFCSVLNLIFLFSPLLFSVICHYTLLFHSIGLACSESIYGRYYYKSF
jgi:hypothetical protein